MINVCGVIAFTGVILPSKFVPLGKIKMCSSLRGSYLLYTLIQRTGIKYFLREPRLVTEHLFNTHTHMFPPFLSSFYCVSFFLSLFFSVSFLCLSSFLSLLPSFSLCQPLAVSCLDKLMYKFPLAPHHGWLPYQGQESALQHLQHFIGILSECRGRQGNRPVGWNSLVKLIKPCTVFDDRP